MDCINCAINSAVEAKAASTQQEIAIALLAKSQAAAKVQGDAALEMLRATASLGKSISTGRQFDAVG